MLLFDVAFLQFDSALDKFDRKSRRHNSVYSTHTQQQHPFCARPPAGHHKSFGVTLLQVLYSRRTPGLAPDWPLPHVTSVGGRERMVSKNSRRRALSGGRQEMEKEERSEGGRREDNADQVAERRDEGRSACTHAISGRTQAVNLKSYYHRGKAGDARAKGGGRAEGEGGKKTRREEKTPLGEHGANLERR